jgi:uridine kinase
LINVLTLLEDGFEVEEKIFDYNINNYGEEVRILKPADIILLEGIFALHNSALIDNAITTVFIDVDSSERYLRRIERDSSERYDKFDVAKLNTK